MTSASFVSRDDGGRGRLEQEANRGRRDVIELAGENGPEKSAEEPAGDGPPAVMSRTMTLMPAAPGEPPSASPPALKPTIVSELTGIRIAARTA